MLSSDGKYKRKKKIVFNKKNRYHKNNNQKTKQEKTKMRKITETIQTIKTNTLFLKNLNACVST